MATTDQQDRLLTVAEVARRLRISERAAYALIRREGLPAVRLGASPRPRLRVPEEALHRWLNHHATAPEADQ